MSINDILTEALKREPLALKEAVHKELSARIVSLLEGDDEEDCGDKDKARKDGDDDDEEDEDKSSGSLKEAFVSNFKRGEVIEVPGGKGSVHKAVVISPSKAVYLEDDGSVEPVPESVFKISKLTSRPTAADKKLAQSYLKNMK
ncbi:MAG: hypothetical protein WCY93_08585 [Anaerolineaceae bacterium]